MCLSMFCSKWVAIHAFDGVTIHSASLDMDLSEEHLIIFKSQKFDPNLENVRLSNWKRNLEEHIHTIPLWGILALPRSPLFPVCVAGWHGRRRRLRRLRRQQRRLRAGDAAQLGAVRPEPPQVPHKGVQILPGPRRMQERCAARARLLH